MANKTGELSEEYVKEITWKIPNFLDLPRREDYYVTSPEFVRAESTWYLRLYPKVWLFNTTEYIKVYLVREQTSVPMHRVHYNTVLKTRCGMEYHSQSDEHTFVKNSGCAWVFCLEWSKIVAQKQLLLPDGTLTVFCKIRVKGEATRETSPRPQQCRNEPSHTELQEASSHTEVSESVNQTEEEEASTSVQKLQSDYSKLLKSEEDSDVCLKVSDKEFRAHRCILRARSKVFSAMFKYDMQEKASGEVVIDDLDPDSFPDFLQHVYAGRVVSLTSKNVSSLYSAADKYDVQELKSECRDYMKCTLSVDTFCDVVTLALRYREDELLKLAIEFFSENLTRIIVTVKWQTFLKNHHTEANELLIQALVPGEHNDPWYYSAFDQRYPEVIPTSQNPDTDDIPTSQNPDTDIIPTSQNPDSRNSDKSESRQPKFRQTRIPTSENPDTDDMV